MMMKMKQNVDFTEQQFTQQLKTWKELKQVFQVEGSGLKENGKDKLEENSVV